MANTKFRLKRSTVSGVTPTTGDISSAELAVNLTDRKLFTSNGSAVFELGSNLTNLAVSANLTIGSTGDLVFTNGAGVFANGTLGTTGQFLTSNGTGVYWSTLPGVNTSAQYTWANVQTFNANVVLNAGVVANSSVGTAGQVLHSNGSSVYWALANAGISSIVTQQFTANGTANSFTVTGGYIPNAIEVYVTGVKKIPDTEVTISSGSTINFATPPLNGQIIDVFGYQSTGSITSYLPLVGGTLSGNLTFTNGSVIVANGSFGSNGQVLTSNGSSMYWSSAGFTNGQSISVNNFVVAGAFTANGSNGSAGQVLTTNGTGVYWSSAGVNTAAQYTWTNTHTYNSNVAFNAGVIANSTVGTAGQVLHSNGSSVYWAAANSGLSEVVTQQFTANGTANSFLVTNGYFPNAVEVYVAGIKQVPGTDVTLTSGSTVNFAVPPLNGQIVDVFGYRAANNLQSISAIVSQQFTANGTANTFTITPGYIPNAIEVYVAGVKRVPVTDVDITSGSTITFTTAPLNGQIVDVFGYRSVGAVSPYLDTAGGTMAGNVTFTNGAVIIANGSFGTNGQVLTSNGSSMYWSSAGFTNGQSISVNNFVVAGAFTANGSNGSAGQVLTTNGTGVYWSSAGVNTAAQYVWSNTHTFQNTVTFTTTGAIVLPIGTTAQRPTAANGMIRYNSNNRVIEAVANSTWTQLMADYSTVRQQFTASNNQTTFTVSGGYVAGQVDVYYNGVKLRNGSEVNVSDGATAILAVGAANNALIEIVGIGPSFVISNTAQVQYQQFTATPNQSSFVVTGGYVPGLADVFVDGIKMVNGVDVNLSSGDSVVLTTPVPNGSLVEVKGYTTPLVSAQSSTAVRQTFTANSTVNNNFTVTGGYISGQLDVYYNGAKLVNGTDVNTSSGSTITLTSNAALGATIDVVGINYFTAGGGVTTPVRQSFTATANQTSFSITGGYTPGQIDVYQNGSKLSNMDDVNVSSGSAVVLTVGAVAGDVIEVVGFAATSYQDSVRKSGDIMTGSLTVSANLNVSGSVGVANNLIALNPFGLAVGNATSFVSISNNGTLATTGELSTLSNLRFNSGFGSAGIAYGCRAWVNFNGTGTVAIRGSGNVSSITDNGTGDYTVNFTTAMPDANYSRAVHSDATAWINYQSTAVPTTTAFRFLCTTTTTAADPTHVTATFFR